MITLDSHYNETDLMLRLKNHGLNVGIIYQEPWAYPCATTTKSNDKSCDPGMGIEFMNTLCDRLRISCHYIVQNITDTLLDTHQMLAKKIIFPGDDQTYLDTALPILVETPHLRENLEFTMPVFYMEHGVLIKTQYLVSHEELFFAIRPFHWKVWLILILAIMSVSCLDALYKSVCHPTSVGDDVDRQEAARRRTASYLRHTESSWLIVFGVLVSRGMDIPIPHMSRRVLMVTWGLSCILISNVYSAQLTSTKVALKIQQPFNDLEEMATKIRSKQFSLLVYLPDSKFMHDLETDSTGPYQYLREAFRVNPPKYVTNLVNVTDAIATSRDNLGLWASQYTLKAVARTNCNVTIVPLHITDFGSFAFKRNSYLVYLFTKVVLSFKERGYYMEKLEQKYSFGRDCESRKDSSSMTTNDKDVVQTVELDSLQMVFWALIFGSMIAASSLGLEVVYHRVYKGYNLHETKLHEVQVHDNTYKKYRSPTVRGNANSAKKHLPTVYGPMFV